MGKNQHSKDRLFLTRTEHESGEHRGHGKMNSRHLPYKTLPFDCCAISFRPFETPMCTDDGIVYDLVNIVPYLKKFHRHPVSGAPLAASDLTRLHFHKNAEGAYMCPVLYKTFNQHTHIVAIKTTGNVFCYDAVKKLNLKTANLRDLVDETPFTRADVITIQNPDDGTRREMAGFSHVNENLSAAAAKEDGGVRHSDATKRIMAAVKEKEAGPSSLAALAAKSGVIPGTNARYEPKALPGAAAAAAAGKARWTTTTGAAAASFTSTAVPVQLVNEIAELSEEEAARQRYAYLKGLKKKGYAQLRTSHGNVNVELHVDVAPQTCENFVLLLERGYYDGTKFHRLIKNFMIQGGDPTGTGSGGASAWADQPKFRDEISNKLRHEGKGILSMANSGPDTNGSQFFMTFKSAAHLDGKHTIFGRVVGGLDVLASLENLKVGKDDRPEKDVTLLGGSVFVNPFDGLDEAMALAHAAASDPLGAAAEAKAASKALDAEAWYTNDVVKPAVQRAGIGKYISAAQISDANAKLGIALAARDAAEAAIAAASEPEPEREKKKARKGGFGDFSGW